MDCCSKIDFAHVRTYGQVSSSLGSNLGPKFIKFWSNFAPKSTPTTDFIFQCRVNLKNLPKWAPKEPQNAWSELGQTALGPLWRHQAWLLVSKAPSQALKQLILTSYRIYYEPIFNLFKLSWHNVQARFRLQSSTHNSYNEVRCSKIVDRTSEHNLGIIVHH